MASTGMYPVAIEACRGVVAKGAHRRASETLRILNGHPHLLGRRLAAIAVHRKHSRWLSNAS